MRFGCCTWLLACVCIRTIKLSLLRQHCWRARHVSGTKAVITHTLRHTSASMYVECLLANGRLKIPCDLVVVECSSNSCRVCSFYVCVPFDSKHSLQGLCPCSDDAGLVLRSPLCPVSWFDATREVSSTCFSQIPLSTTKRLLYGKI